MVHRYRGNRTPEQREEAAQAQQAKLARLHRTLTQQVSALASGPQWRAWLEVAARFHNYSFNNTLLLAAQKPDATQVAGYNLWKELGRQVSKGEKGLMILAPVTRRAGDHGASDQRPAPTESSSSNPPAQTPRRDERVGTAEPAREGARQVVGFRPAYVWDISQTTGAPLPTPPTPQLLAGQAPAGLWEALAAQCTAAGFSVTRRTIAGDDGPNGFTAYATKEVVIRSDVDDAQAVKTLAHELGHVLMHDPAAFLDGETTRCRGAREVEAESVAYLVAADHGLETGEYTFAYVAGWAAQTGDVDAALAASGTRVLTTARQVLDTTEAAMRPPSSPASAQAIAEASTLAGRAVAGATRTTTIRTTAEDGTAAGRTPLTEDQSGDLHRSLREVHTSVQRAQHAVAGIHDNGDRNNSHISTDAGMGYTDRYGTGDGVHPGRRMGT